ALSTSPVVDSQTTAWYWARFEVVNWLASSVAVTENSLAAPSCWMAEMSAGMASWRKPAVLEKTSTLVSGAADAAGAHTEAATRAATAVAAARTAVRDSER